VRLGNLHLARNGLSTPTNKFSDGDFAQLPSFDKNGKQNGWLKVSNHRHGDILRQIWGQDAQRVHATDEPSAGDGDCLSSEPIMNDDLPTDMILKNLPMHISSLNSSGIWQTVAPGNREYFRSIENTDFRDWVNQAVHVQDRVVILKAVSDCRSEDRNTIAEFRLLGQANMPPAPQWAEIKCTPISSHKTILTVLRDVSERKVLENKIREERQSANAANIAKTRFLANMSHELRTPLNAIIGFSEILKSGMVPASNLEKQQEYQGLINDSAQHLLTVLNDILDMSKIEAGKYEIYPEDVDLMQIILSCCSMLMPLANKAEVELCINNPHESFHLEADSRAVRQIIINLISNAIKFTKSDTKIHISAIRIGRRVQFEVCDQGKGITPDALAQLGKPFHQIDGEKSRRHEGSGLGLSIVKGLVQLHEGNFDIQSEIEVGTTVTVGLPICQANNQPVPGQEVDTVIRIKPNGANSGKMKRSISRLVG